MAFERREMYWLNQIRDLRNERVLFILGDDHLESFAHLLQQSGIAVSVKVKDWVPGRAAS